MGTWNDFTSSVGENWKTVSHPNKWFKGSVEDSDNSLNDIYNNLYYETHGVMPDPRSNTEKSLQNQFALSGNSKLEQWANLARNQALGAGYNDAAAAQLAMRAKNRGWLSMAEQADEWSRRMAELAYAKKAQAAGIDTTSFDAAAWKGFLDTIGG